VQERLGGPGCSTRVAEMLFDMIRRREFATSET